MKYKKDYFDDRDGIPKTLFFVFEKQQKGNWWEYCKVSRQKWWIHDNDTETSVY